jgi:hypothetical protein
MTGIMKALLYGCCHSKQYNQTKYRTLSSKKTPIFFCIIKYLIFLLMIISIFADEGDGGYRIKQIPRGMTIGL